MRLEIEAKTAKLEQLSLSYDRRSRYAGVLTTRRSRPSRHRPRTRHED